MSQKRNEEAIALIARMAVIALRIVPFELDGEAVVVMDT
jgi:hypothetical protein